MIKSHIKRMFSYFSRIYHLGEEVKRLKDGSSHEE
jgi:hypothetical protein